MAANFDSYLDIPMDNVSAAKPLPLGHFFADIVGWKTAERDYKTDEGKVPVIELSFKTTGPDDDVDPTELPGNGGVGVLATKDYRLNAPKDGKVEGGAHAQMRRLAEETLGLDTAGLSLRDTLDALKGQPVKLYSEPRADKREEGVYHTNIVKVLSPED